MYLKLDPGYTDPSTQQPMPDAVLVVWDTEFALRRGDTRVVAQIYASPSLIGVAQPSREFPIALSTAERDSQLPALMSALYAVLEARAEYAGSTLVT